MDKKLITIENNQKKEYDIILEFTSNDTKKQYIFYNDKNKEETYMSYYRKENDMYILNPIKDEDEIKMCKSILEDIKNYK